MTRVAVARDCMVYSPGIMIPVPSQNFKQKVGKGLIMLTLSSSLSSHALVYEERGGMPTLPIKAPTNRRLGCRDHAHGPAQLCFWREPPPPVPACPPSRLNIVLYR